jgi:hypothetical protein
VPAGHQRSGWQFLAVTRDSRSTARIRITCRDESELARVKEAAEEDYSGGVASAVGAVVPGQGRQCVLQSSAG